MQKSSTFTTTFRLKKCYFHYDYACKKVPLSLRYAKNEFIIMWEHVRVCLVAYQNSVHRTEQVWSSNVSDTLNRSIEDSFRAKAKNPPKL
jgi:hypothetical protein